MVGSSTAKKPTNAEMRVFLDTNILVYAEAVDEPVKRQKAQALLQNHFLAGTGVVSTQVLQEYCNVALRKLKMPHDHVVSQLEFFEQFEVVQVTPILVREAVALMKTRALSYFDALIVASALAVNCDVLWSEDMNPGEFIGTLQIQNPYA